jgi:DnaJ-class molecular chaperone
VAACPTCLGEGVVRDRAAAPKLVLTGCLTCGGSGIAPHNDPALRKYRCALCGLTGRALMSPMSCATPGCRGKPVYDPG